MMTAQRIAAIATKYKGVQFRSRLEARWAAMFDQFGWEWEYEPIDAVGYIPDFIVRCQRDFVIEVKPYDTIVDEYFEGCSGLNHEWRSALDKMINGGISKPKMVFGSRVHKYGSIYYPGDPRDFGAVLGMVDCSSIDFKFKIPVRLTFCTKCETFNPNFICCIRGCEDKHSVKVPYPEAIRMWTVAGNLVQYKGATNG